MVVTAFREKVENQMAEPNIYHDFIEDPVQAELFHIKAYLAALVVELISLKGWKQAEAAIALGVAQPRISEIRKAKLEKFSVDFLLALLVKLGYQFDIDFTPKSSKKPMKLAVRSKQ